MRGTGWHRCVFILYEQNEPIDYNGYFKDNLKLQENEENKKFVNFDSRTFKTFDFYLKNQDKITPVSFLFFQTQWDSTVQDTFYNKLSKFKFIYIFC